LTIVEGGHPPHPTNLSSHKLERRQELAKTNIATTTHSSKTGKLATISLQNTPSWINASWTRCCGGTNSASMDNKSGNTDLLFTDGNTPQYADTDI